MGAAAHPTVSPLLAVAGFRGTDDTSARPVVLRVNGDQTQTPSGAMENDLAGFGRANAVRTGAGFGERLSDGGALALSLGAAASVFGFDLLVDFGHMAAVPYAAVVLISLIGGSASRTFQIAACK